MNKEKESDAGHQTQTGLPAGQAGIPPEANFSLFMSSLGLQASIALGLMPSPITKKTEKNLEQAKFLIDTLAMIQEKTKGNLTKDETETLERLLYELRMIYVKENK